MADQLTISGGGSFAVASDELFAAAQRLRRLAAESAGIAAELAAVDQRMSSQWLYRVDAPIAAARAEHALQRARAVIGLVEAPAMALHLALASAIDGYGFVDAVAEQIIRDCFGNLAGIAGFVVGRAPWLLALAIPVLPHLGAVAGIAFLGMALRHGGVDEAVNALLSDPAFVATVRMLVSSADEAALGALGVPPPAVPLLADDGLGVVGTATVAGGLLGAGSLLGQTRESPVRLVSSRTTSQASPARSFADRIERIPRSAQDDGVQVVIERHVAHGRPDRFEVFIGGTADFAVGPTVEPWDTTSNIGNAAGDQAASVRAVREAMALAGVEPGSPVLLTGYSQGGAVAAILAASGDYAVEGVLSFGGNTGHVPIPRHVPAVLVEHTDDIVPAAGGVQRNNHAVLVERQAMAGRVLPEGVPVPAHHLSSYLETATMMDAAASDQLTAASERLAAFGPGGPVTRSEYHFVRDRQSP